MNCCSASGLTGTRTCTGVDYAERIYDSRRQNFWDYACPWQFATGNATVNCSCSQSAQPNARSRPTLRYTQPNSFGEYLQRVHGLAAADSGDNEADGGCEIARAGGPDRAGCVRCPIVPNCGNRDGAFASGEACAPQPVFKRRMVYNGGPVFKPASRLPILDRYQWAQPESMYYFDSPQEFAEAYDGIYNGNAALRARFNFQNPAEQTRLWAGVPPPVPPPAECANPSAPHQTCGDVPVPYYRNYLESRYACGCNRQRCTCDKQRDAAVGKRCA